MTPKECAQKRRTAAPCPRCGRQIGVGGHGKHRRWHLDAELSATCERAGCAARLGTMTSFGTLVCWLHLGTSVKECVMVKPVYAYYPRQRRRKSGATV